MKKFVFSIFLISLLFGCATQERVDLRRSIPSAVPVTDGGGFLSTYHSEGQALELRERGWNGIWDKYLSKLDLRNRRIILWYPYTPRGYWYFFRQTRPDPELAEFARRVQNQNAILTIYLPCPTTGDVWEYATVAEKKAKLHQFFDWVPARCEICIDEMQGLPSKFPLAAEVIDEQIATKGRNIFPENWWYTYNTRWYSRRILINSDEYNRNVNNPAAMWRPRTEGMPRPIIAHHEHLNPEWDVSAQLLTFARECGSDDWIAPIEVMVNQPILITFDNIDPKKN